MSSFMLKIIGALAMLIDHAGKVFWRSAWWMECVGRLAFPIFAYQTAVGYDRTRDRRQYAKRLVGFAIVSQVPYGLLMWMLRDDVWRLNVGFTLLLAVGMLAAIEWIRRRKRKWWVPVVIVLLIMLCCGLAEVLKVDYGAYGVAMVGLFAWLERVRSDQKVTRQQLIMQTMMVVTIYVAMTILKYLTWAVQYPEYGARYGWEIVWVTTALLLILAHNGKRGRKAKYFFYIFYPAHLMALYIIYILLQ